MRISARTVLVAWIAALAGAVVVAAPAAADITVTPVQLTQGDSTSLTPAQPVQGGPARLAFTVTSTSRTASTTKVQVLLPEDTPIAEVYPLSAPDWAPSLTEKRLPRPIQGIHGRQVDRIVTAITWTPAPGRAVKPGQSSILQVEAGPMPAADQIVVDLAQTYSDGTVTRSRATVTLGPPAGQAAPGHNAHGGTAPDGGAAPNGGTTPDGGTAQTSAGGSAGSGGTNLALIISVLAVGLLAGALIAGLVLPRLRRGAAALTVSGDALDGPEPSGSAEGPDVAPATDPASMSSSTTR